jgi:uncharacterized protein YcfL
MRFVVFILISIVSFGCSTKEEQIKNNAISVFNDFLLWEDARMLKHVDFQGPVLIEQDTSHITYGWYYNHNSDTFWVHGMVNKNSIDDVTIHPTDSYIQLGLKWEEIIKQDK